MRKNQVLGTSKCSNLNSVVNVDPNFESDLTIFTHAV